MTLTVFEGLLSIVTLSPDDLSSFSFPLVDLFINADERFESLESTNKELMKMKT